MYNIDNSKGITFKLPRIVRLSLLSVGCLWLAAAGAEAQINRSQPPSPPASRGPEAHAPTTSGGNGSSSRNDNVRAPQNPAPRVSSGTDRGRTPVSAQRDTVSASGERGGAKALDRYNKSQESTASKGSQSSNSHARYYPYFPYGYFPGDTYGYPPYPYPYPGPYPYPTPRGGPAAVARYDSPYFYCDDLTGGQYVNGASVTISKPKRLYTPTPLYKAGDLSGWRDLGADDYLADRNAEDPDYRVREQPTVDAAMDVAVADIREAWLKSDVEPLARHLRKEIPVAIVLHGKYLYSLEAGDLLEVTRAAYSSAPNLRFILDHLRRKADGVFALTGRHIYNDVNGNARSVYFTYILVKSQNDYVVTQMASASDRE